MRHSTSRKTQDTESKRKEREMKEQLMKEYARKRNVATVRRLTQEELLAEAKITEEMNLRSLGKLAIRFMKFLHLGSLQHMTTGRFRV